MCSPAFALPAFEVAVAGAGTTFARSQFVGIHRQAHAATSFAPIKTSFFEHFIQAFFFGMHFYFAATRYDHRVYFARHLVTFDNGRRSAEVFDSSIRARSNEDPIDADVLQWCARF